MKCPKCGSSMTCTGNVSVGEGLQKFKCSNKCCGYGLNVQRVVARPAEIRTESGVAK